MGSRFNAVRANAHQKNSSGGLRLPSETIRQITLADLTGESAEEFLREPNYWRSFDSAQLSQFVEELVPLVPSLILETTERGQALRKRLSEFVALRIRSLAESYLPKKVPPLSELTLIERINTAHRLPLITELPDQTVELDYRAVQYLVAAAALIGDYTADVEMIAERLRLAADSCSVKLDGGQLTMDPFIARLLINDVLRQARECCGDDSPALVAVSRIVNYDLVQSLRHRF